ncbi:putative inorganic carbon transporter subunit DabA [Skermanella pratensis]|uniref:putative inorganic carbon transporter subunit DabA n=1 Tax=Skermanella pratensis TaxID=2233999 RepID=UPI00248442EE|nr:putative inorganic carbon transporter subunit DabA [Skermanella pratensis]
MSSFTYVETTGLLFGAKMLSDGAGLTRTVSDPDTDGLDRGTVGRIGPRLAPRTVAGRQTGFTDEQRVAMAEAVLRAMSLTEGFARLVMLTGHGSTTVNNPHASGLDCGACGGHTGEANARVAAAILNDPGVRAGLKGCGIAVPEDTWFLGCLHDTTTDEITIHDADEVPKSHAEDLEQLRRWLAQASALARMERSALLGLSPQAPGVHASVIGRSRDWAQVRPEWGLAGNAAFIAAPRARTRGIDLGGRAFLHNYDWRKDTDFNVLTLIMTAPLVVASWINLQYYGSTVNNRAFGSGNKVLHNVTGTLGVLEGNAGDLKVGLPWQSVHDGTRFVHEPLRLNAFIEAPVQAIDEVIAKNETVRNLVDNAWIHLFAISESGRVSHRYRGGLTWEALV